MKRQKQHAVEFHSLVFPAPASKVPKDAFFFLWIIIFLVTSLSDQCICFKSLLRAASKQRVLCSVLRRSNSNSWHNLSQWPSSWIGMGKSKHMSMGRQKCSVRLGVIRQEITSSVYFFLQPLARPPLPCSQYLGGPLVLRLSKTNLLFCPLLQSSGGPQVHCTAEESALEKPCGESNDWCGKCQ